MVVYSSLLVCLLRRKQSYNKGCTAFSISLYTRNNHNSTVVQQHELLDARLAWTSNDEHWEVAIWGKNLTKENYISHSYVIGPGVVGVWGPPRTYGVTASYSY